MLEEVGPDPHGAGSDPGLHQEHRKAGTDREHGRDEQQGDRRPVWVRVRVAANSSATSTQVITADSTDRKIAQLTRLMRLSSTCSSPIQRSCSAPRLANSFGSMSRERSTMRERREAQTFRKAPIPLSRKTGATARRTISATVETERLGAPSNIAALCHQVAAPHGSAIAAHSSPLRAAAIRSR